MQPDAIEILKNVGIVVMPSDTIFGIFALALNPEAVEKLYQIKGRKPTKPFIILISTLDDLNKFGIQPSETELSIFKEYWPGMVSIVLPCSDSHLEYLHRGSEGLAFRLPDDQRLIDIIKETGPLVAPSANPEGEVPAKNIDEAKNYFGDKVNLYLDGPTKEIPSTLIAVENGKINIIRQGAVEIKND